jgi:hypothetical protein
MEYHNSLIVANKLLAEIEKQIGDRDPHNELIVYTYYNSREQGYAVLNYINERAVNFSNDRNSDNIFVSFGNLLKDFEPNQMLNSEAWKDFKHHRKYFKPEQYKESAEFIINFLLS